MLSMTCYAAGVIGGSLIGTVLIALDKCSGLHPISDGEVLLCILWRDVALATQTRNGVAQLCSGLQAGMEGAIHAVCELFDLHSDDNWGVLLVNAWIPLHEYFSEPFKTVLVVWSSDLKKANDLFHDLGVCLVTSLWFLGGFVGEQSLEAYMSLIKLKLRYSVSVFSIFVMLL